MAALVAGALPDGERAAIANHAAACNQCHALLDGLVEAPSRRADTPFGETELGSAPATHRLVALRRGTRIGRYVIERVLGAGGMGVVYAALDSVLHRKVALKLLHPNRGGAGTPRLIREARSLARLSHQNVVTVFDVGAHRGQQFISMELVEGGNLNAWLRDSPRTTGEIIDCLLGAGRGLAAAHAAGIVHRDVKPDNILVGLDGRARMTDFGVAQHGSPRADGAAMLAGTPAYMAPEQRKHGTSDALSDQWSFCATLYEVLAGVRPFAFQAIDGCSTAIVGARVVALAAPRHVPGWVRKIVTRGLLADPAQRWPSMDALLHALALGRRRQHLGAMRATSATISRSRARALRRRRRA